MGYPRKIVLFSRRLRTLLANERKSARQPDPRRASGILQALNWLTRPVYSSGDPLRSPCLGSSRSSISLAVSFASKVRRRQGIAYVRAYGGTPSGGQVILK